MQKFYGDSTHWGIGVVEDIQDPLNQGRVRVRIHGLHTFDNNKLAVHELPWSGVAIAANSAGTSGVGQTPTGLVEGSFVFGIFLDGSDKQDFLVTNALTGTDTATARQGQSLTAITTSLYGDSNPERMYSYFRDILGFTEEEAAGALGATAKFMGSYTLTSVDVDHGEGRYGIGNWDATDTEALRSFASISGRRYEEFDTQLLFLGNSLQHTDAWPNHSEAGQQLGALDASEAADSFAVNVLRLPLDKDRLSRHDYARQALDAYGSSTNGDPGLYPERGAPTDLVTGEVLPSEEHVYRYIRSLDRNISELIVTDTNTQPGADLPEDWADETHFLIAEDGAIQIGTLANQPVENMPAGSSVTADGEMLPASRFTTSQEMRDQMKRWESLVLTPYVDAYGYSIGYGYFIGTDDQPENFEAFSERWMGVATSDRDQISITEAQADELFDETVERFENVVYNSVTSDITQSQFDALVALSYNLGNLASSAPTLLRNVNSGNYAAAADSFTLYVNYTNMDGERIRSEGLYGRRLVEAEYFRRGNVGVNGVTLRNHRQFSIVVTFQGGQRNGGGRANSYSVEQFNALRVIAQATTRAYPAVSIIGLRDLDDTSNRPLFDVRQFFESTTPTTTSNPIPAPATVPDTSGVQASAESAGGDAARPATAKANAKAVNQSKNSPNVEPDVPTPNADNSPSVIDLDSDAVETATGDIADLSAPTPPVSIPSPFLDPILGPVGTSSGLGLDLSDLDIDTLSESEVQQLIDSSLIDYVTLATAQSISGAKTFTTAPDISQAGTTLLNLKSTDNSPVQYRFITDSENRRIVARNGADSATLNQIVFLDDSVHIYGPTASDDWLCVDANGITSNGATVIVNTDTIDALSGVTLTSPSEGEVLKYVGGQWVNASVGAGSGLDADLLDGQDGTYYLAWANLTGVPSTFAPSAHTHVLAEITDLSSTSDLPEGTNLYYTQARFNSAFTAKDTDDLSEGISNFYYTEGRFNTSLASKSTSDLSEGTNLYYTQGRFDSAFTAKSTSDLSEGTNLYYTQGRFDSAFTAKSTSDLGEGTNLYYTTARANSAIDARVTQSFVNALNVNADSLDGIDGSSFVRGDSVDNGAVDINVNDADFILQDSTDGTTNWFWRDHSASLLYIGTAAAVPTFRADLNVNSNDILNVNEVTAASGGLYVTADDVDFAVRDTTDSITSFIFRDWSSSKLFLGADGTADVFLRSDINTNGYAAYFEATANQIYIRETDAAVGEKQWTLTANNSVLTLQARNDSYGFVSNLVSFDRDGGMNVPQNLTVLGDLTVSGTTTYINTTQLDIGDNIFVLNADETGAPTQNAGMEIERGTSSNVAFIWNETTDTWQATSNGSDYYDVLFDDGAAAGDAATLDGLDSTQFLRSDVDDTMSGDLTVTGTAQFGSKAATSTSIELVATGRSSYSAGIEVKNYDAAGWARFDIRHDSADDSSFFYQSSSGALYFRNDATTSLPFLWSLGGTTAMQLNSSGLLTLNTGGLSIAGSSGLALASGVTVSSILDEDTMSSNSATALATQQSIKAYVDSTTSAGYLPLSGGTLTGALTTQGDATFEGNVGIGGTPLHPLHVNAGSTNLAAYLQSTDATVTLGMVDDTTTTSANGPLVLVRTGNNTQLWSGGSAALILDSSQNAEFEGTIGIGVAPISTALLYGYAASGPRLQIANSAASTYFELLGTTANARWVADGNSVLVNNGAVTATFDTSNNATFEGAITAADTVTVDSGSSNPLELTGSGSSVRMTLATTAATSGSRNYGWVATSSGEMAFQALTDAGSFSRNLMGITHADGYMRLGPSGTPQGILHIVKTGSTAGLTGAGAGLILQDNVATSTDCRFEMIAGTAGSTVIRMGDADAVYDGQLEYDNATRAMGFKTANALALTLNSSQNAIFEGNVGIGITPSSGSLHIYGSTYDAGIFVEDSSSSNDAPAIRVQGKHGDSNFSPNFAGRFVAERLRTDAAIANNGVLGTMVFGGNHTDGTAANIAYSASISAVAEGTFNSATDMPTALVFYTGDAGQTSLSTSNVTYGTEAMRIASDGDVTIGSTQFKFANDGTYSRFYIDDKAIFRINDAWLRINNEGSFTNGIYCGTSVLRTDGQLQISANGATFLASASALSYLGNDIWHEGNDGSGSGLDADLLDGIEAAAFAQLSGATFTGDITISDATPSITFDGAGGTFYKSSGVFVFDGCTDFWSGLHIGTADAITEGGVNKYPRAAHYWSYTGTADPTNLTYNIKPGNSGTIATAVNIQSHNDGDILLTPGDGYVGLGTAGPNRPLHVYVDSTSTTGPVRLQNVGTGDAIITYTTPAGSWVAGHDQSTDTFGIQKDSSLNSSAFLSISSAGNTTLSGTLTSGSILASSGTISVSSSATRDKFRLWNSSTYTIGMDATFTYGDLNDYAMTFQMNNVASRGWWWGHSTHTNAQGAMALTTDGRLTVDDTIVAGGNVTANSDATLKDIGQLCDGFDIIDGLEIFNFIWKKNGEASTGVIAQEVQKYAPQYIHTNTNGILSVDYGKLAAHAVYEEKKKREALEDKVENLEAMVEMLMEKLNDSTE